MMGGEYDGPSRVDSVDAVEANHLQKDDHTDACNADHGPFCIVEWLFV